MPFAEERGLISLVLQALGDGLFFKRQIQSQRRGRHRRWEIDLLSSRFVLCDKFELQSSGCLAGEDGCT